MTLYDASSVSPLLDLLFDESGVGRCLVAPDGSVLRANREWLRSTGLRLDDVLGANVIDLFPETRDMALAMHARARAGHRVEVPRHAQTVNGHERWWEGRIDPVPMEGGTGLLITASRAGDERTGRGRGEPQTEQALRESEERTRAQDALRESEARLRLLFRNMLEGYAYCQMIFDEGGRASDFVYLHVNDAFERLTGLHDVVGRKVSEVIPGIRESQPDLLEAYGRVARTGQPERFEIHFRPLAIWLAISVYRPSPGCFVAVFDNITERKRAELALKESEEAARSHAAALETVLDAVPAAVWIARDVRGDRIDANRFGAELLRRRRGDNVSLSAPGQDRPRNFRIERDGRVLDHDDLPLQRAARLGEEIRDAEMDLVFDDGEIRHLLGNSVPLLDAEGRASGSVGAFIDVTGRKRAEDALRAANKELRESDRRKTEFLAVLSHELRNPLAPIRNSVYVLDHAAPGSEQVERAKDVIRRQTDHLARLVDDLLDLMRISRGKILLKRERVDLREVVRRSMDDVRALFERVHVELRLEHAVGPVWLDADPTRIAQVMGNILNNAQKFTPVGGAVTVRMTVTDRQVHLCIADTGVGMQPGQEERMFEPFAQGDQGVARTRGGLGLGLSLVKSLVEMHGGSVSARSEGLGRGTEIVVSLPLAEVGGKPAPAARAASAGPTRDILVIEDNPDAAQTLADVLALKGHTVIVAADGRSGLALARQRRPKVILCDVGLPDIDGYEVARAVRSDPTLGGTKLVALTGYAQPEDRQRAIDAGFDVHLPKPADTEALSRLLAE